MRLYIHIGSWLESRHITKEPGFRWEQEHDVTMCFGRRNKSEADAERSQELDKMLRADEKKMQREVKLLLLGTTFDYPPSRPSFEPSQSLVLIMK